MGEQGIVGRQLGNGRWARLELQLKSFLDEIGTNSQMRRVGEVEGSDHVHHINRVWMAVKLIFSTEMMLRCIDKSICWMD